MLLAWVVIQPCVLAVLGPVLLFFPVGPMRHHHQGRAGDEGQLEGQQGNVGYGEEVTVADVGATWLAVQLVLLDSHHKDQHEAH